MTINRPDASEFAPFYAGYIGKVPDSGPVTLLEEQIGELEKLKRCRTTRPTTPTRTASGP